MPESVGNQTPPDYLRAAATGNLEAEAGLLLEARLGGMGAAQLGFKLTGRMMDSSIPSTANEIHFGGELLALGSRGIMGITPPNCRMCKCL